MYSSLAWRNLWRNKRRTGITVAAVAFAVMFAVALRSMQLGAYANMIDNAVRFYSGFAQVHKKGYWDEQSLDNSFLFNDSLVHRALQDDNIQNLVPRVESYLLASNGTKTRAISVAGIAPEKEKLITGLDKKIIAGSYLDGSDAGILLANGLSEYLDAEVGDTIVLVGIGYHGANAAGKYPVKGIIKFNNPELNKRYAFLSLTQAQRLFDATNVLTSLVVVTEPDKVNQAVKKLKEVFGSDYEVMDWREMMPELVQAIEADSIGGIIILFILYIVIGFGIFGTIVMMTAERRHEFGVLIALGMKRVRLLSVVALESILLAMLGVTAGILISLPVVVYFFHHPIALSDEMARTSEAYGMEAVIPFSLSPEIFIYQALSVLALSLLAMSYPFFKIRRLQPSEAMRA
ncbi:MAG TPA: FtsX-like permease family protein [Chitinophagales bacterium]|nr:FtsX-like permease family protein [Chitinophagales bacterium]